MKPKMYRMMEIVTRERGGGGGRGERGGGRETDLTRGRQRLGPLISDTCDSSTQPNLVRLYNIIAEDLYCPHCSHTTWPKLKQQDTGTNIINTIGPHSTYSTNTHSIMYVHDEMKGLWCSSTVSPLYQYGKDNECQGLHLCRPQLELSNMYVINLCLLRIC